MIECTGFEWLALLVTSPIFRDIQVTIGPADFGPRRALVGAQATRATPWISKVRPCANVGGGPKGICMVVGQDMMFEISGIAVRW